MNPGFSVATIMALLAMAAKGVEGFDPVVPAFILFSMASLVVGFAFLIVGHRVK